MSEKKLHPQSNHVADDFQTPSDALLPLYDVIPEGWTVWECAEGEGYLVDAFEKQGYDVVGTGLKSGTDFLEEEVDGYDCIVTNPPYSLKDEFLRRCYELGKPFALLMPLTALEGQDRQDLYKKYGVQMIVFYRRINFITPSGEGQGSWFMTAWFTHGFDLGQGLNFVNREELKKKYNHDNQWFEKKDEGGRR